MGNCFIKRKKLSEETLKKQSGGCCQNSGYAEQILGMPREQILPEFMTTLHDDYRDNIGTWSDWMFSIEKTNAKYQPEISYDYTPKEVEVPEEDKPFNLLDTMSPAQLIGYNKRIGGEKDDRPDWVKLDWDPKRNAALDQGRNQLMPGFRRDPTGKYVNDVLGWEGTTLQDYWRKWDEIEAGRAEWQTRFPNWWQSNPWRPDRTDEERGAKFDPKEWYPDEGEKKGPKKDLQDRLEALLYGEGTDQTYGDLTGQQQSGAAIGNLQGAMHMYEGPNGGGDLGDFNDILRSFDVPPWTEEQFLGRYPDAVVDMDAVADAWYLEGDIAGAHWNPDDLDKDGD